MHLTRTATLIPEVKMKYRPEEIPCLLSNEQETRFRLIGTIVVAVFGLAVYGLVKLLVLAF